jgi:hypothetical protein
VTPHIHAAPDWRVPLAIVGTVVVLAAVVFVYMLVSLSNSANRSAAAAVAAAPAPTQITVTTATAPAATTTPTTPLAVWPPGVTGYTVVLGVIPSRAAATKSANKIAAAGIPVGVLYSSDYSSMTPGDWIVFSGTYTTDAAASAAATQLQTKGQTGAYAYRVVPKAP